MAEQFLTLMAEYSGTDQERISIWYEALQNAGFRGSQTPGLRHHISLATFPLGREAEAIQLTRQVAAQFGPVPVAIRHIGVMPGGQVLFAAPDTTPELLALQRAASQGDVSTFPFLPHTTLLIDTPETIATALPTLVKHFTPLPATIDRLRLCAFWPTREIVEVKLEGESS